MIIYEIPHQLSLMAAESSLVSSMSTYDLIKIINFGVKKAKYSAFARMLTKKCTNCTDHAISKFYNGELDEYPICSCKFSNEVSEVGCQMRNFGYKAYVAASLLLAMGKIQDISGPKNDELYEAISLY